MPEKSPFLDRSILLSNGGIVLLNDGDFSVRLPSNTTVKIRLRTGLPLFPITSPQGEAPAEYVIRQLETKSLDHAYNSYGRGLRQFCRFLLNDAYESFNWREADETLLLRYLSFLRSEGREYEFARIRHFYRWATDAGYPGFSREISDKLDALRIHGNPKGEAVLTGDPEKGALSDEVFQLLLRRLKQEEQSMLLPRACTWLSVEFGANPAQYCQLRKRDLIVYETSGEPIFHLELPRSKKRDGYRQRIRRPLSAELGRLLVEYIAGTEKMRADLGMDEPFLLLTHLGRPMTDAKFSKYLRLFAEDSSLSNISGKLNARRFRRTFGTRVVEAGASKETFMDLMDHSDNQNLKAYFEMRGKASSRIDASVDSTLGPLAARFMGRVVDSETDAALGDLPEQRVKVSLETGDVGIGTCAHDIRTKGLCQLHPPYACYTCPLFQPWRDADHQESAETIQEQRNLLVELEGGDECGRVVGQLDELLRAVNEVVEECESPLVELGKRRRKPSGKGEYS